MFEDFFSALTKIPFNAASELSTFLGFGTLTETLYNSLPSIITDPLSTIGSGFVTILAQILSLLPDGGTLPQAVHDSAETLGTFLYNTSYIFPVYDLMFIISLIFILKISLFGIRVIIWGISMVRGNATGSPF